MEWHLHCPGETNHPWVIHSAVAAEAERTLGVNGLVFLGSVGCGGCEMQGAWTNTWGCEEYVWVG